MMCARLLTCLTVMSVPVLLSACASVPPEAVAVSERVTRGIDRLAAQHEATLTALVDVQLALVEGDWDEQFARAERAYLDAKGIPSAADLTLEDRADVARIAADVRQERLNQISHKQQELLHVIREDTQQLTALSRSLTGHYASLVSLQAAQSQTLAQFQPLDLTGLSALPPH